MGQAEAVAETVLDLDFLTGRYSSDREWQWGQTAVYFQEGPYRALVQVVFLPLAVKVFWQEEQ